MMHLTPRERWAALVESYPWLQSVTPGYGLVETIGTMLEPTPDADLARVLAALCRPDVALALVETIEAAVDCRIRRVVAEMLDDRRTE